VGEIQRQQAQCDSNFKEDVMLSLRFSTDDYAFVYTAGRPIGAILVGQTRGRSQLSLLFCGQAEEFEILRPQAVERRFGRQELDKLRAQFLRFKPRTAAEPVACAAGT
jgi:hypothetical protein